MNQIAFDELLDRIDAEIAEGPVPLHKIAASITVCRDDVGVSRPRIEDIMRAEREEPDLAAAVAERLARNHNTQATFALQPSRAELCGMGVQPEPDPCPPATPQRSWLSRLLFRRTR
jgi:hypothetical protein